MDENKYIKIKLTKLNGYVYVEKFRRGEEENRSKIFDENMLYLDYIDTEHLTYLGFNKLIDRMRSQEHISDFLENCLYWEYYTYSIFLDEVVDEEFSYSYKYYDKDTCCKEEIDKMENDRKLLSISQFCTKYGINKIGQWYIYNLDI